MPAQYRATSPKRSRALSCPTPGLCPTTGARPSERTRRRRFYAASSPPRARPGARRVQAARNRPSVESARRRDCRPSKAMTRSTSEVLFGSKVTSIVICRATTLAATCSTDAARSCRLGPTSLRLDARHFSECLLQPLEFVGRQLGFECLDNFQSSHIPCFEQLNDLARRLAPRTLGQLNGAVLFWLVSFPFRFQCKLFLGLFRSWNRLTDSLAKCGGRSGYLCGSAPDRGSDSNLMMACENRGVRRKRISLK